MKMRSKQFIHILCLLCCYRQLVQAACISSEEEAKQLQARQTFSLESKWLRLSSDSIVSGSLRESSDSLVRRRFEASLGGEEIELRVSILGLGETFTSEATFTTTSRPEGSNLLSDDLLRTLANIVDCRQTCGFDQSAVQKTSYRLAPLREFSAPNQEDESLILVGHVTVKLNRTSSMERGYLVSDAECELCQQVAASGSDVLWKARQILGAVCAGLASVWSLLEPHHWVIMIVALWLTVCLVIAVMIQKRDKRRLRIYLEERADYSFAKRPTS